MLRILPALLCFVFPFVSTEVRALEMDSYLESVWERSEQLKGKSNQRDLADGDRWRRFIPNEPQFFFISQDNAGWQQAGLTLNVPFPGRSLLMTSADAGKSRAAYHDLKATKLDVTRAASDAFLDCASSREIFANQQKSLSDMQTFSRTLDKLYERGHSTQAETLAAKLQLRQLESDIQLSEAKGVVLCDRVKTFYPALNATEVFVLPEDLSEKTLKQLGDDTVDTLRSKAQIELAKAQSDTAIWKQLPDITVSALKNNYFVPGSSPVGLPLTYSFQATVTLPVFFLFNEVPEAQRQLADARIQRDQAEVAIRLAESTRRQAVVEFKNTSRRLAAIQKEDLPMAEAMIESSMSSYRSGRLGFAELMLSRRIYNDLRNQKLQLQVNRVQLRLRCLSHCDEESP